MFLLYNGNRNGSQEARLVKKVHDVQSQLVIRNAARTLRLVGQDRDSAEALEEMPFELWEATNGFGDRFDVLYMKVPIEKYLEIELEADTYQGKARYENIAKAMEQASNPVRFVGMEADTEGTANISTPVLQVTSIAVTRALRDFEVLVSSGGGTISGVDRIHTAFHGYLKAVCDEAGIPYAHDADLPPLDRSTG